MSFIPSILRILSLFGWWFVVVVVVVVLQLHLRCRSPLVA